MHGSLDSDEKFVSNKGCYIFGTSVNYTLLRNITSSCLQLCRSDRPDIANVRYKN